MSGPTDWIQRYIKPYLYLLPFTCSHIGVILFKIEAAVRFEYNRQTCTDVSCKWNACFMQRVQPAKLADIRFYKRDPVRRGKTRHPPPSSTSDEQASFVSDLASGDFASVCLSTFTEHNERFVTEAPRPTTKLPFVIIRGVGAAMCRLIPTACCNQERGGFDR